MANNLLVKSDSRGIQRQHVRRYESGKVTRVNPGVKGSVMPIRARVRPVSKPTENVPNKVVRLRPRVPTVNWQDVLKVDTTHYPAFKEIAGIMPGDERKKKYQEKVVKDTFSVSYVMSLMWRPVTKNEEDFIEIANTEIQDHVKNLDLDTITLEDAENEAQKIAEVLDQYVSDTGAEEGSITYSDLAAPETEEGEKSGFIGAYTDFNVDSKDIQTNWVGRYRGYYDVVLPEGSRWSVLHEDTVLSLSNDAANLENFDELLTEYLDNNGIKWARVGLRTSNVCSGNYVILVEKCQKQRAKSFVKKLLKRGYRSEESFQREVNPLYSGVKNALSGGMNSEELREKLGRMAKDPEIKKKLDEAINLAKKDKRG